MAKEFKVEAQGLDKNPLRANGDYGVVEFGEMNAEELLGLLQEVLTIEEPDYSSGDDLCQPNVLIDNPGKGLTPENLSFSLGDGELFLYDTINDISFTVSPFEAVSLASGHKTSKEMLEEKGESEPAEPVVEQAAPQPPPQHRPMAPTKAGPLKTFAKVVGAFILTIGICMFLGGVKGAGFLVCIIGAVPIWWGMKGGTKPMSEEDKAGGDAMIREMKNEMKREEWEDQQEEADSGDDGGGDFE